MLLFGNQRAIQHDYVCRAWRPGRARSVPDGAGLAACHAIPMSSPRFFVFEAETIDAMSSAFKEVPVCGSFKLACAGDQRTVPAAFPAGETLDLVYLGSPVSLRYFDRGRSSSTGRFPASMCSPPNHPRGAGRGKGLRTSSHSPIEDRRTVDVRTSVAAVPRAAGEGGSKHPASLTIKPGERRVQWLCRT